MNALKSLRKIIFTIVTSTCAVSTAQADVSDFYAGKQLRVVVGSAAGGGYDAYARLVADNLGRYIPGKPTFIVQNMPGAGSLVAVNYVANVSQKDGSIIGAINPAAVTAPLFKPTQAKFDPRKFNWLGSPIADTYVAVIWHTAPVQKFDQLFTTELIVASSGGASSVLPLLTNGVLGTKYKIVEGYKGTRGAMLALERGEAFGNGGQTLSNLQAVFPKELAEKKLLVLVSYGLKPIPDLADVPRVIDYAKTPEQKAALNLVFSTHSMGWPYLVAGGVPQDRVDALRSAFQAMTEDKDFREEAKKRKLNIIPVNWAEQTKLVDGVYRTDETTIARVRSLLEEK